MFLCFSDIVLLESWYDGALLTHGMHVGACEVISPVQAADTDVLILMPLQRLIGVM